VEERGSDALRALHRQHDCVHSLLRRQVRRVARRTERLLRARGRRFGAVRVARRVACIRADGRGRPLGARRVRLRRLEDLQRLLANRVVWLKDGLEGLASALAE
jgi:hypothetical protein